jgi:hypothetical protein
VHPDGVVDLRPGAHGGGDADAVRGKQPREPLAQKELVLGQHDAHPRLLLRPALQPIPVSLQRVVSAPPTEHHVPGTMTAWGL